MMPADMTPMDEMQIDARSSGDSEPMAMADMVPPDMVSIDVMPYDSAPPMDDGGPAPDMRPTELCNLVDDDGDGRTDEGFAVRGGCEADGRLGCLVCTPQGGIECVAAPVEDLCDGIDHDCDGVIDEGAPCNGCSGIGGDGDAHAMPWLYIPEGWICIPPGRFCMGSPADEPGRQEGKEDPYRNVHITRPFLIRATEMTQGEWVDAEPACNPSRETTADAPRDCGGADPLALWGCVGDGGDAAGCPVTDVTLYDAVWHADRLSGRDGLEECYRGLIEAERCNSGPGRGLYCPPVEEVGVVAASGRGAECAGYRLPTEAEWEYAARATAQGPFGAVERGVEAACDAVEVVEPSEESGDGVIIYRSVETMCAGDRVGSLQDRDHEATLWGDACHRGWFEANSGCRLHAAALKLPNRWGLYDMHGNVSEWVNDWRNGEPDIEDEQACGGDAALEDPPGPVASVLAEAADFAEQRAVVRGGSYHSNAGTTRSATVHAGRAGRAEATRGYRLVRTVVEPAARRPCGLNDDRGFCAPRDAEFVADCVGELGESDNCGQLGCCVALPCRADDGRTGTCRGRAGCEGTALPGLCPGNADIACCLE